MFFKREKYFLIVDVGGTKTSMAVTDKNNNILVKKLYLSKDIKNFTDTLIHFMHESETKKYHIEDACIAAAGQINSERNYARLTNLEWTIDKQNILVRTKLRRIILLNDFEAIGFGIDTLKSEDYTELTNIGRKPEGTIAIIGPGTGLGVSVLTYEMGKHLPIPSEGGHVSLPIQTNDSIDIKFQSFLLRKKLYKDAEDVVSGRGIVNIYKFLLEQKVRHDKKIRLMLQKTLDAEKPAIITKYALEDKDILCIRTLELFIKYYARIARNLVLTTMCSELVLAGGIAPKILPALQDVFVDEFVDHEFKNMRKILETVPIIVLVDPDIGLYGASNIIKS
jgi:glucokinase